MTNSVPQALETLCQPDWSGRKRSVGNILSWLWPTDRRVSYLEGGCSVWLLLPRCSWCRNMKCATVSVESFFYWIKQCFAAIFFFIFIEKFNLAVLCFLVGTDWLHAMYLSVSLHKIGTICEHGHKPFSCWMYYWSTTTATYCALVHTHIFIKSHNQMSDISRKILTSGQNGESCVVQIISLSCSGI